eukprot:11659845-Prorocentrum_lima.AAC.1
MTSSLVGSEMCIRDSLWASAHGICTTSGIDIRDGRGVCYSHAHSLEVRPKQWRVESIPWVYPLRV